MEKVKVSHQFEQDDGTLGTRSTLKDGMSLPRRIFIRMAKYLQGDEGDTVLIPGVNAYNCGQYEEAARWFTKAVSLHGELLMELQPHLDACKRVIGTAQDGKDLLYEEKMAEWQRKPALLKKFLRSPTPQIRCKYCGHYTQYIDPLDGLAYLGTNNCTRCGRGYPMPDFSWDGLDGQAYIYYRHSVTEDVFYYEFEERYDVFTPRDHFLKKVEDPDRKTAEEKARWARGQRPQDVDHPAPRGDHLGDHPKGRILVVDHDLHSIEVLSRILGRERYDCLCVRSVAAALHAVRGQPVDLILSELMMPEMDGFEFCEWVHADERLRRIPFIILTGKDDMESRAHAKALGVGEYLTKPISKHELLTKIEQQLAHSQWLRDRDR